MADGWGGSSPRDDDDEPPAAPKLPPPAAGAQWRHRNGNLYVVLMLTNLPDDERYPLTVVYRNPANGTIWSRRADDWHRSFTPALDMTSVI